jgi:MoaA/NifB/PqqE/SkfB family radical SAM enzyme
MAEKEKYFKTDSSGDIIIPAETAERLGVNPGDHIKFNKNGSSLTLRLPMSLAKLYIEVTNQCNLNCVTCIRNVWDETPGIMSEEVFNSILEGLRVFPALPEKIFFGGFGEPLSHPHIISMISMIKQMGMTAELITNGTLLKREMIRGLIESGLDTIWVSLDGATSESFSDIRMGALLPNILENLSMLNRMNNEKGGRGGFYKHMKIGIVFVAMKRNMAELPAVIEIAKNSGAEKVLVTNLLPYTEGMTKGTMYYRSINRNDFHLDLPVMDMDDVTLDTIRKVAERIHMTIPFIPSNESRNRCPFIEDGAGAIAWNGDMSPCLPLLHSHEGFLGFLNYGSRHSRKWAIGNILDKSLSDIWNSLEHRAFRERVMDFDFSPCITCGGCDLSQQNEEDCIGNKHPTCGACLWAQGVIRCP